MNPISITLNRTRQDLVTDIQNLINQLKYTIVDQDINRPWGGYFRFDEHDGNDFKARFFQEITLPDWAQGLPFSPKILFTAPHKRLSWQYHKRRGEVWKMLFGNAQVYTSQTDDQPQTPTNVNQGEIFQVPQGHRHRLCATHTWVVWAEMWIHTNPDNPSQEDDNIRVQDDFGR